MISQAPKTKASAALKIKSLDIFIFNAVGGLGIDSYERMDDYKLGNRFDATSTYGEKHIVLIANCPADKLMFTNFSNYADLENFMYELEDENTEYPIMCGESDFYAGKESSCTVSLSSLLCEIVISKIMSAELFNSITVHLENFNSRAPVLGSSEFSSYSITSRGTEYAYRAGLTLYCYPYASKGGLGSPHTEISISCRSGKKIKSYNITVNDGNGIERNSRYVYSINME